MIGEAIDKLICLFSPAAGLERMRLRASVQSFITSENSQGGYEAGKRNRLTKGRGGRQQNENAIPRSQVAQMRWSSWDLFRNNPHCRKICRSLNAKVIGTCPHPQSQAVHSDGTPNVEFRDRAQALFTAFAVDCDYRGKPGFGGQNLGDLLKTGFRGVILGGEVLIQFRDTQRQKWARIPDPKNTLPPLKLQLIHAERFDETVNTWGEAKNPVFYGIELDENEHRVAYHILDKHPSDPLRNSTKFGSKRLDAKDIVHLFASDDIDQMRGTPWLSAALLKMRDTNDYESNELMAAAMSACVVMGYRRSSGQSKFGVSQPENWDLNDANGNPITGVSPGMFLDLGQTGELDMINPSRPNVNADAFIQHMLRSEAASVPGTKGSTLTLDYRNSSFSSERSADNDTWPEIEDVQDWFYTNACQPIYNRLITAGIQSGWFDGVLTAQEFAANQANYLAADWQGPVARSINPVQDAVAAKERISGGVSSPQRECRKIGVNCWDVLKEIAEFQQKAQDLGVSEDIANQILGIEQRDLGPDDATATTDKPKPKPAKKPAKTDKSARNAYLMNLAREEGATA